jgi:Arc/MetJ family transcription regulator
MRMKRTNLVLDEQLLEEAVRLGGARTYSQAVNEALADYTRRIRTRQILDLAGLGLWSGDLSEMRRDRPARRSRKAAGDGPR